MIITRLNGGLGNQMFQYAAGLRLAIHHDVLLKLDISSYDKLPNETYRLDCFENDASIATAKEVELIKRNAIQRSTSIFKWRYKRMAIIEEKSFNQQSIIDESAPDTYLVGDWRSVQYFEPIEATVHKHFTPKKIIQEKLAPSLDVVKQMECPVGLHVRRRGKNDHPRTHAYYGNCDISYYDAAIEQMVSMHENMELLIFSDDITWAKQHISAPVPIDFVESYQHEHPVYDLYLMSHCRHNIIANSLYSWWAARLNNNTGKTIIAPEKWFASRAMNKYTSALVPDEWITL